jgi:fluoroquinolone resistance protein
MEQFLHERKKFDKINYAEKVVNGREFQDCRFHQCDFSNSNFSGSKFIDCHFDGCNLAMIKIKGSTLNNVAFKECKMLGVDFSECQEFLFSVAFDSCVLDYSSFMGRKMVKTRFIKTSLKEVNFTQANLSDSVFEETDLSGTIFNRTDLSAAKLLTAFNYSIDPELNLLKKATFSREGLSGLLDKYKIRIV